METEEDDNTLAQVCACNAAGEVLMNRQPGGSSETRGIWRDVASTDGWGDFGKMDR